MIFTSIRTRTTPSVWRLSAIGFAAGVLALTSACEDPFAPRASTAVRTDSFTLYSVTQTPINAPAAFNIVFFTTVRLEPTYSFDLAFDIDDAGNAVVIPSRLVGGALTSQRIMGLQKIAGDYAALTLAPVTGYQYDSTVTLALNEGVAIELQATQCDLQTSRTIYAKLQIQAIDPATRRIAFRVTYDPNCGFRSFLPGVPTE